MYQPISNACFAFQLLSKPKFSVLEKIKTIGSTYMVAAGLQPGKEGERAVRKYLKSEIFWTELFSDVMTPKSQRVVTFCMVAPSILKVFTPTTDNLSLPGGGQVCYLHSLRTTFLMLHYCKRYCSSSQKMSPLPTNYFKQGTA